MAGKVNQMIEAILTQRSQGDATLRNLTRTKLILKGINPDKFTSQSDDDPGVIQRLKDIAQELGVAV